MIYSLSLFRHPSSNYEQESCGESRGRFFFNYLPSLLRCIKLVFPDATIAIHHDNSWRECPYGPVLNELNEAGLLRLIDCGPPTSLCEAMLWRLKPCFDTTELVVCRDIDALPMARDLRCLRDFVREADANPGLNYHVIHDSGSHCGPFMGGMMATLNAAPIHTWRSWEAMIASAPEGFDWNRHGADQNFLNSQLVPRIDPSQLLVHQLRGNRAELPPGTRRLRSIVHELTGDELFLEENLDPLGGHIGAPYVVDPVNFLLKHFDTNPHLQRIALIEKECGYAP